MKTLLKNAALAVLAVFAFLMVCATLDDLDQRLIERANAEVMLRELEKADPMEVLTGAHFWNCGNRKCELEQK